MSDRVCQLYTPGLVAYQQAWDLQKALVSCQKQGMHGDVVLLVEHPPVFTLGQGSQEKFLKFDIAESPHPVVRIERGGEVTYHGPGQIVCYPILNLHRYRLDLHWYLRQLEEVVIRCLSTFGLQGDRLVGLTGVWIGGHKVAAIGIKVSRWITMHGLALNVCPDMAGFDRIVPCGIVDKPVGSLNQFCPGITAEQVQQALIEAFAEVFEIHWDPDQPAWEDLLTLMAAVS